MDINILTEGIPGHERSGNSDDLKSQSSFLDNETLLKEYNESLPILTQTVRELE